MLPLHRGRTLLRLAHVGAVEIGRHVFGESDADPGLAALQNAQLGTAGQLEQDLVRAARTRAQELLDVFDLSSKRQEGYKRLSGGMKRRLLIARALMHSPKILILDEPTAGVDLELRYHLWDFLRRINKDGITILLTTHYIEEAEKLCSRIGVIHQGKIAALDATGTLIRKMSGDQVELYLKTSIPAVPPEIKSVRVFREENGKRLRFEEKENAVNEVLKALHQKGFEIERIDVRRPTLEDAFLKLTGKKEAQV